MDYEKKYKDALERAEKALEVFGTDKCEGARQIFSLFPELKESEDEKIRKGLIDFVKSRIAGFPECKRFTDWLEKQGEQKHFDYENANIQQKDFAPQKDIPRYSIGDVLCDKSCTMLNKESQSNFEITDIRNGMYICDKCSFPISQQDEYELVAKRIEQKPDDKTKVEHLIPQKGMYYTCIKDYYSSDNTHLCVKGNVYKSPLNGYIDDESHFGLSWTNSCAEKYFEPTKNEDWIVCEHDNVIGKPMQYKEFKEKINQKFIENLKAQGLTPKLRLWNLQDAKDGDVLYVKGSYFKEYLFMFSSFTEDNVISTHFGYDVFHGTFDKKLTRFGRKEDFISVTPATKEQRDLLLQKMKEAGYEWDTEKKELKKIEPIDDYKGLTNFERAVADVCIGWIGKEPGWKQYIIDNANVLLKIAVKKFSSVQDAFLEPKPAYLEEFINGLSKQFPDVSFAKLSRIAVRVAKWAKPTDEEMKELLRTEYEKGRADAIAEMQKPAWSEEDNKWIESLIQTFEDGYLEGFNQLKSYGVISWLKSIKERCTWKPNEEQLKAIKWILDGDNPENWTVTLTNLYNDLKKL